MHRMTENVGKSDSRMPVLFVGHGSPMNIVDVNDWSRGFQKLAGLVPTPRAILAVSAHWFVPGSRVTIAAKPATIHDFYGFPDELYAVNYPALGDPELAERVTRLLGARRVAQDMEWGLDHGTWTVLRHMYPKADIPVVQLSVDRELPAQGHFDLGRALAPLRNEGVLILASGNIVHNLRYTFTHLNEAAPEWATGFDEGIAFAAQTHDGKCLVKALEPMSGRMSHPTPDHYLPLLYAAGASDASDTVTFPIEGFDLGSLSMRSILWK